jgi:acyl-CoA synthetase (AMP-forming)/AMP-acid ligase II
MDDTTKGISKEKAHEAQYPKEIVLGEALRRNTLRFPNRLAVAFQDRRFTYREFNTRVNKLANALIDRGIKKGDRIAIFGHNSDTWVTAALGILKAGGAFVPTNFRLVGSEVEYIVNHNDSVVLFIDHELLGTIKDVKGNLKVRDIIVMRGEAPEGMLDFEEVLATGSGEEPDVEVWEGDFAFQAQTGGTTGRPKGVVHTHRSMGSIAYQICFIHNYREPDRGMMALPAYSSAGVAYDWAATLLHGGSLFIHPSTGFNPVEVLELIHREKINHITLAPVMLGAIMSVPEEVRMRFDVSSLHSLLIVGAPSPQELRAAAIGYFGEVVYVEYSASEHGVSTLLRPEEVLLYPGSSGRAAMGQEVKVVDLEGNEVPRGQTGEIVVAGTQVSLGYYKNPEANRDGFLGRFLGIGDMGYMDEEGHVYIVDRKSDMIISGGSNIYPAEIETVMINHPDIEEVAVIGVPDDKWGESVKAVIRLKKGATATEKDIIEWCRGKMAGYRVPRSVDFVSDYPRTAAGKVQKKALREQYWKAAGGRKI